MRLAFRLVWVIMGVVCLGIATECWQGVMFGTPSPLSLGPNGGFGGGDRWGFPLYASEFQARLLGMGAVIGMSYCAYMTTFGSRRRAKNGDVDNGPSRS